MINESVLLKFVDWLFQLLGALRGRPRIHIRIQEDKPDQEVGGLKFEIENRRWTVTSLDPKITVKYHYLHRDGHHVGYNAFYLRDAEQRRLDPFQPKILTASADRLSNQYWLSFFRTYTFRPTSGLKCRVRVRNVADLEGMSPWRFAGEYVLLRYFNRVIGEGPENYTDWRRKKRARGPH